MVESFLFYSVKKILGTVTSLADQEFFLAWGLESDLKKLERSLSSINAVILDAEEQQTTNHAITNWLGQLKRVLYDAEDVLDEFAYQVLRNKVVNTHGGFNQKVRRFFSGSNPVAYRLRIGHKIKDIRLRLDEIAADKAQFNLVDRLDNDRVQLREREMTHSFVNASDVVGRDGDKESIVKFLTDVSHGHDENVSVIPIVGIGGLGKTALAQMVFNDVRVVGHFDLKAWVCLGDVKEFHVNQVMANIVKSITGEKSVDISNPEHLQQVIREKVENKRFLVVLDDLWDADRSRWLKLKALLGCGVKGSKIVVTTRISSVASCVGTVSAHNLAGLPHNDCVLLFKKLAFASDSEVDQSLMKIGDEIVKKCKGVPLAVRSVGSLLFLKSEEHEWLAVKDSDIWQIDESQNGILHILKYSYDHLPSYLKQCFIYCSIFPEDYEFNNVFLISFWMAHGLLKTPKKTQGRQKISTSEPEYVGEQYIKELLCRGFFQEFEQHSIYHSTFKMHDLVHDLACSLGGEQFAVVNADNTNIGENVRHVWFERQIFSTSSSNASIQTVLVPDNFGGGVSFYEACNTKFKHLKVLGLNESIFLELPKSIGTLKHLRLLKLQSCRLLYRLPDSICKLHNLQTLLLHECADLEELPKRFGELINLRLLTLTTKQKQLPKNGIECLTCLRVLLIGDCPNLESLFEGTQLHLTSLRILHVDRCKSLISFFQLSACVNVCLPALELLYIEDCVNLDLNLTDQEHGDSAVVSQCLKLPSLRHLTVKKLQQLEDTWPQWIQGCANTLQSLEIDSCDNLKQLPEWLPNLTSLRTIKLLFCGKLVSLPQGMERLKALKELMIIYCGELSIRCDKGGGEDWPKIAHVPNIIFN